MTQINFRVNNDEKLVLQALAEFKGVSVAEFAKQVVLKDIGAVRIDLAFKLLSEGKISRKRAWVLSGLTYHEFMLEWAERHAEELGLVKSDLISKTDYSDMIKFWELHHRYRKKNLKHWKKQLQLL
ncbi:MAG: hypothetical protein EU536_02675 [Promethearchaeota archaeon]|nr:MAG: hypothetical protein EU536_02675 [Candidatus Lokiarchaeota archaeon]